MHLCVNVLKFLFEMQFSTRKVNVYWSSIFNEITFPSSAMFVYLFIETSSVLLKKTKGRTSLEINVLYNVSKGTLYTWEKVLLLSTSSTLSCIIINSTFHNLLLQLRFINRIIIYGEVKPSWWHRKKRCNGKDLRLY